MDILTFLVTILVAFVIYIVIDRLTSDRVTKLVDKIPGPLKLPIFGTTYVLLILPRSAFFQLSKKFIGRYGPIIRTWMGRVPIVHCLVPEYVELVLNNSTQITKSHMYYALYPWLGDGLLTSTGAKWHRHRKLITPTFHFKILENFMEVFVEKSKILVDQLREKTSDGVFDLYPYITRCTLDIICETAMGVQINAMFDPENEYVKSIYGISKLTIKRMITPWLHPDFIFYKTNSGKRYNQYLSTLHNFTSKVIQDRRNAKSAKTAPTQDNQTQDVFGIKKRTAFLDLFIDMSKTENGFTDLEIREQVDTFMFEGHDTTTAAINWTLFLLGHNQEIQNKVYEEIENVFQGYEKQLTINDLGELKLLERCCKEALRLYPSVPVMGRKLTEDIKFGEYIVPADCTVTVQIIYLHRNPNIYPNPEKFDPDRFLPENSKNRHPYAYIPFSAGPRNCIGQKFAMYEEKTILAYLLKDYKVTSVETEKSIKPMIELVLRPENGLLIKLEPRKRQQNTL